MTTKSELQEITSAAAARLAAEKARKQAAKSQIERQKTQLEVDDVTEKMQSRILQAAEGGSSGVKIFEWKQGEGITNRLARPPIAPDSVPALVLSYCVQNHGDLNPQVEWIEYRPSRPFGPCMHVWGIFLNWA